MIIGKDSGILNFSKMGVAVSAICGEDMDSNYPTPEIEELTKEEVEMILETWKIPALKLIDSGETILYRFLERYPMNQQKFAAFKNMPLLSLKGIGYCCRFAFLTNWTIIL